MTRAEDSPGVTVEAIVAAAAQAFDMPVSSIMGRRPTGGPPHPDPALPARQAAMWLAVQMTRLLYGEIGAAIGGRDRKTVRVGAERIDELIKVDAGLADLLDTIRLNLAGDDVALPPVTTTAFRAHPRAAPRERPQKPPAFLAVETAKRAFETGDFRRVRIALNAALAELAPARGGRIG